MWGGYDNSNIFSSLERLHCRAAKNIFNLLRFMSSAEVLELAQWPTRHSHYKLDVFKHIHRAFNNRLPEILRSRIIKRRTNLHSLRARDSLVLPRFNTRHMKHSIAYRGAILLNAVIRVNKDLTHTSHRSVAKYTHFIGRF